MIQSGLVVALATLAAGLAIAFALRALPTLRLRLVGLAVLAVCLPLIVVLASGWVMFEMGDDVKILAVSAASASVALVAALVIAGSIERPIERLARAAAELAGGDLAARAPEDGPAEVASLARDFNEMGNALARIFDARRELVAWASHDLRTPLANMQAMLEALEDGLAEPADYLPALRDQVRVLSQLVDDLFELGRIEAGALALELRELPITPVVERCLVGLGAEAAIRGVRLETVGRADATARFAPDKIERVLLNLLTNALRHTPTDGCVAVVVKPATTRCTSGWRTPATASTPRASSGCSSASGAATRALDAWRGSRPRHRAGPRRSARRTDLGRAAYRRRHERLLHASRLIAGRHRSTVARNVASASSTGIRRWRRLPGELLRRAAWAAVLAAVRASLWFSPRPAALMIRAVFRRTGAAIDRGLAGHAPGGIERLADEPYGDGPDDVLDVYHRTGARGPAPTIVWVHGGAFVGGSKEELRHWFELLADEGYTVVAPRYSLAPESTYPTPVRQVVAVLGHVCARAGRLRVDPDRHSRQRGSAAAADDRVGRAPRRAGRRDGHAAVPARHEWGASGTSTSSSWTRPPDGEALSRILAFLARRA